MAKPVALFACSNCGAVYPKWMGRCSACEEWNTIAQQQLESARDSIFPGGNHPGLLSVHPQLLSEISADDLPRIDIGDEEFNRVLGGGLVRDSFVLLGGEPGIGKSTLILQTLMRVEGLRSLYISGEESASQLKMRAERIGVGTGDCFIYPETNIERILAVATEMKPDILIVDSIQTIYTERADSSPGSVSQIRETATLLLKYSKTYHVAVILIGHITKEGSIAGPKILEHTVDTVLQFEGDKHYMYRLLRVGKNRFGSTGELGIYEMSGSGLRPVSNPSEHLITQDYANLSGIAIASTMEGARSMLIEAQALVSSAIYANPQRSATGFDLRRMNMLLAVLEKRSGFRLVEKDVFLNIAGGIRTSDPASDLAVITAILSSSLDIAVVPKLCLTGEVGLAGEIRPVSRIRQRINEAARTGFDTLLLPKGNLDAEGGSIDAPIRIVPVSRVEDAFRFLFSSN